MTEEQRTFYESIEESFYNGYLLFYYGIVVVCQLITDPFIKSYTFFIHRVRAKTEQHKAEKVIQDYDIE